MKGFEEYNSIDKSYNLENTEIKFVGNLPASIEFKKMAAKITLAPKRLPRTKIIGVYVFDRPSRR